MAQGGDGHDFCCPASVAVARHHARLRAGRLPVLLAFQIPHRPVVTAGYGFFIGLGTPCAFVFYIAVLRAGRRFIFLHSPVVPFGRRDFKVLYSAPSAGPMLGACCRTGRCVVNQYPIVRSSADRGPGGSAWAAIGARLRVRIRARAKASICLILFINISSLYSLSFLS